MMDYKKPFLRYLPGIWLVLGMVACGPSGPKPAFQVVREITDIKSIDSSAVAPIYYHNESDFNVLNADQKKQGFINMVLPAILMARHNLRIDRLRVRRILRDLEQDGKVSRSDSLFMRRQTERLNAISWKDVYDRLATHPVSIVLAQAAVESGWGSSRFFREGNNLFGIWSFNPDEDRIAASNARDDGAVYLRSYPTLAESVEDYFITLARHNAYREFREKRLNENDPRKLIYALHRYSELGYEYVRKLSVVMRQNDLRQFDTYHLDSAYVIVNEREYF